MARQVTVAQLQAMQHDGEGDPLDDAPTDPYQAAVTAPAPTLSVPQQLRALQLHMSKKPPYDEVLKRLKVRAELFDIPALDEEIAAEARRRCGMAPEPAQASVQDETSVSATTDEAEDAEPAATMSDVKMADDPVADLMVGEQDADYPTESDIPCDQCGGVVILRSAEEDRRLASRVAEGVLIEVLCDACAAAEVPVEPKAEDQADDDPRPMEDRLADLDVGAQCTAEMSLSMITGRVREASYRLEGVVPTEAEIVAEAERIWWSFDANRKGPREYDVNPDGTIRDWRRPDPGPQRDPFEPTVHTISDDTVQQRFSGGGATDGDAQQQSLFLVPNDAAFNGKLYRDAPELANIAEKLIGEHGFLRELVNCEVRWYWKRKTGVSKGRVKIGFMKRASDLLGHFSGADFIGWLSATTARDGKFSDTQIEAAVMHQLLHIGADDKGNWIFMPHDFEGFAAEVRHYGTWTSDLKLGGTAFVAAHQMGLFTDEADEDDDEDDEGEEIGEAMERRRVGDDGAGVLVWPDGRPMSEAEIAEMEASEVADDDEAYDDDLLDHDV